MDEQKIYKFYYTVTGEDNNNDQVYTFISSRVVLDAYEPRLKEIIKAEPPPPYDYKLKKYLK